VRFQCTFKRIIIVNGPDMLRQIVPQFRSSTIKGSLAIAVVSVCLREWRRNQFDLWSISKTTSGLRCWQNLSEVARRRTVVNYLKNYTKDFENDALFNREPMKLNENWCDLLTRFFRHPGNLSIITPRLRALWVGEMVTSPTRTSVTGARSPTFLNLEVNQRSYVLLSLRASILERIQRRIWSRQASMEATSE